MEIYCLFGKPVEVEDSDVRDKSIVENKTCGRMTHHKLSGKKLLSHAETEKVNNNSRLGLTFLTNRVFEVTNFVLMTGSLIRVENLDEH
ncbi:hypothetical protein HID58_047645 [Brassica napus]|uniref:Uncharacterized protein n=1 Tax=Brassica napus TaxID=3708 RepID=A0ABQ8AZZ3_BRANA|nr:hypothetical protein HID58_047645 [Brassica napus]